jgi:hypothetical protein
VGGHYCRGWADRLVDFQRLQELAQQPEQSAASEHFNDAVNSESNVLEAQANRQLAGSDDQHFNEPTNSDPTSCSSEPTPAVKVKKRTCSGRGYEKII